jgi:translation initiation factor 2 subunit 1
MQLLNCRYHEKELPDEGEIVVGKISEVTDLGVFIEIVEYDNLEGLIVVGELTRKRISNATKAVKSGKIEVLFVSRVDRRKKYVDLSRIKVTSEERQACLQEHYRKKLAHNTMITIAQKADIDLLGLYESLGWPKTKEFGSLFNFFIAVQSDSTLVENEEFKEEIIGAINLRFKVNRLKINIEIKVGCFGQFGVVAIRNALLSAAKVNNEIEISLVKPPIYSISISVLDSKKGLCSIEDACSVIKKNIEQMGGYFQIKSKPMIYGESKLESEDLNINDDTTLLVD